MVNVIKAAAGVEILKFAAFYNEGLRGVMGGAPKNDKVWGIANVNGKLVTFWGRRNGALKLKTFSAFQTADAFSKYQEKIGGRTSGDVYTPIVNPKMIDTLSPTLLSDVRSAARSKGLIN